MQSVVAFFRLIRWPNLLFIIATQFLFYNTVLRSCITEIPANDFLSARFELFIYLMIASVTIAAAGYIINDYFDLQIDKVNKPERVLINRYIKRRSAIIWHWVLSGIGLLLSFYVSYKVQSYILGFGNLLCVLLLWVYSTTFKRKVLTGNVIIAALTAWTIVTVYFLAGAKIIGDGSWLTSDYPFDIRRLFKFTLMYAAFAFVLTLIREVVKDLEDMDGDAQYQCNTMPIAWGVPAAKVFAGVWTIVLIGALAIILVYAFKTEYRLGAVCGTLFILLPSVLLLFNLKKATTTADYNRLSTLIKLIMLAGILSMLFFIP